MATRLSLQHAIRRELRAQQNPELSSIVHLIATGEPHQAAARLIFFTAPASFPVIAGVLLDEIQAVYRVVSPSIQEHLIAFLTEFSIALTSFLPRWSLHKPLGGAQPSVAESQLRSIAIRSRNLAAELASTTPAIRETLLSQFRTDVSARLKAEGLHDPDQLAQTIVGESPETYIDNLQASIHSSNLGRIAEMRANGKTVTEVSNDYAAFLEYSMYLGASFVTCNPPLIDIAWTSNPTHWNRVVDAIISTHPDLPIDLLARIVTLEIVFSNMLLLRPIFLLTEGGMGCVSLQVNPKKHDDSKAMVRDATEIYDELCGKLDGGVPNVVFKVPATQAGLTAARELTSRGIGVNITVSFGLFQELAFATVINRGSAIFSTITHMTGRLAFAVRDELLGKLDMLRTLGITEQMAREAAAWSGIAVLKRFHMLLKQRRIDTSRVRPLVASLRVYEGESYVGLPSPVPDITEAIGTRIITVFPNVRYAFDKASLGTLDPGRIEAPVPHKALDVLVQSEIFRQAYFVADQATTGGGERRFRPGHPLSLRDKAAVAEWPPVRNTLYEFCESYDRFVQRILERRARL